MENSDKIFEHFRENLDFQLPELTVSQASKRRILEGISNVRKSGYKKGIRFSLATAAILVALIVSLVHISSVYAQVTPLFSNIITWIKEVSGIPVNIPQEWQPIKGYIDGQWDTSVGSTKQESVINYSFFVDANTNQYTISVYSNDTPVPVSQSLFFGQKNIPFGYSEYGSISGQKISKDMPMIKYNYEIPKEAHQFELIPGLKSYKTSEGTNVWWEQGNWIFEFTGTNHSIKSLRKLATEWLDVTSSISSRGHIEVIEGNITNTRVTWDKDGIRYTCYIRGTSKGDVIKDIIDSIEYNIPPSTPTFKNIASRIQKISNIPVAIPVSWAPFIEYDKYASNYVYKDEADSSSSKYSDTKYYYFEVLRSNNGYRVDAYHAKYPVAFNDKETDLQKNGPKFSERFAGSFSAERLKQGISNPEWPMPKSSPQFLLVEGATAYDQDNGGIISWKYGNWTFKYHDNNSTHTNSVEDIKYLKEFATLWNSKPFIVSGNGHVEINRDTELNVSLTWEDQGIFYSYSSSTTDINDIINVINSFKESEISVP